MSRMQRDPALRRWVAKPADRGEAGGHEELRRDRMRHSWSSWWCWLNSFVWFHSATFSVEYILEVS